MSLRVKKSWCCFSAKVNALQFPLYPQICMSLSDSAVVLSKTTVIAISITSLLVVVLLYTCGAITVLLIQRLNKHYRKMRLAVLADDPLPTSVTHTSELAPVYEDILPPEKLEENRISRKHCIWTSISTALDT